MECPRCKSTKISVIDSRDCDAAAIRRRRECDGCDFRFTTYERIEPIKLMVQKRDGAVEPYQREKIIRGLQIATEKREISPIILEEIADRIELKLMEEGEGPIPSKRIGDFCIRELRKLDHVAYLRFASVYRSFASLEAFEKEMKKIKEGRSHASSS